MDQMAIAPAILPLMTFAIVFYAIWRSGSSKASKLAE